MRGRRWRVALATALAAPLVVGPVVADASAPALRCPGTVRSGSWERIPVEVFRPVPSVRTADRVLSYAVDAAEPQRLLATNGTTVKTSRSHGCSWEDGLVLGAAPTAEVPLSGTTSTVVATALLPRRGALAAVREGTGAASRPHVLSSANGASGTWSVTDSGLPAQGAPRLLVAGGDGRTAYLVLSPTEGGAAPGGLLPEVPGVGGGSTGPVGLLYATIDGGASWVPRTGADSLAAGGIDQLAVDRADPARIYVVASGRLLVSTDAGRSFTGTGVSDAVTVEAMEPAELAVATRDGDVLYSVTGGRSFSTRAGVAGLTSLAFRKGDGILVGEAGGRLFRLGVRQSSKPVEVPAGVASSAGSAKGDRGPQSSFHVLAGHSLLRWVDPAPPTDVPPPPPLGALTAPPPPPGRVDPPSRSITMPVGESRLVDFTLVLPKSPTPLDLFFLIDTSGSMKDYIDDVKTNLASITGAIAAGGIDLAVGLGAVGTGPAEGETPYPEVVPGKPGYRKPVPYRLVHAVGPVDAELTRAVRSIAISSTPPRGPGAGEPAEGQLIGLEQLLDGRGVRAEGSSDLAPAFTVPPGQQARFRDGLGIRRIVVNATDEAFAAPYGTPMRNGKPDSERVAAELRAKGVVQVGLAIKENGPSVADLSRMARLTGAVVPKQPIDCGDGIVLSVGRPLVCDNAANFSDVIPRLVRALADRQSVALVPKGVSGVLGGLDATSLRNLDVTVRNDVPFRVRVSCVDVAPGSYASAVDAVLRGTAVATAKVAVTCTAPAAAAVQPPPAPDPVVQDPPPAAQPVANAPAPPAPAPPVVQPQVQPQAQAQVQTQAQLNPMTAAALQQQEELQLALALSLDEGVRGGEQLAMVDRRRSEELAALALLGVAMAATSALGLARLRTQPRPGVRRDT